MTQVQRRAAGGRIDRSRALGFSFDGVAYTGHAGDNLASALLANGVHLVGRSFKYHRPRGIMAAGADEPNALVGISRGPGRVTPNLRATQVLLHDGLVAISQNRFPSLAFDFGALAQLAAPLLAAGFYYKTFMGPRALRLWPRLFEKLIRRAAGLGQPPVAADPDRYAQFHAHCDVLVVGGGPAGIAAALAAGATGVRVILCDEQNELGGTLLAETTATLDGLPAAMWLAQATGRIADMANVMVLPRTQAFGYYAQNLVALAEGVTDHLAAPDPDLPRERLWQVRAREVVLATGAIERPLPFPDNDRPGIMLADAARTYLHRYATLVGRRVVVATAHDDAYRAAVELAAAGVEVAAIADLREHADGPWPRAAREAGLRVMTDSAVCATRGRLRIRGAGIVQRGRAAEWIACDALLMSNGWTPSVHLFAQSRGSLAYDEDRAAFVPDRSVQREQSVGACRGTFDLAAVLAEGAAAGRTAASRAGATLDAAAAPVRVGGIAASTGGLLSLASARAATARGKVFVDFQNDVCASDIVLAVREGMHAIEHIKRYTTSGMATDQGKTSNMNALAVAAAALGTTVPQVGLTSFRLPYTPVSFGSFAGAARGALFDPVRTTPLHDRAQALGAVFEDAGQWKRAWYFPRHGEDMSMAVHREVLATRCGVGLFDASSLGKIEVVGPDAAQFLERLYTNPWARLAPGRCRYGVMLSEAGFIMDDGVIARLAADRFHVTTTTGGAAAVLAHMEDYLQTEFPAMRVWLTSTTEQWAVIAVQGPLARAVLEPLVDGIDISRTAMPHMSVREGTIAGVPTRLMRVSFTGELGFEINVPAGRAGAVWGAVWQAAQAHGGTAYGTEAMHVMRAEKGHIIVGQETDGTVTPVDCGLDWAIGKAKGDFVGKRSLVRPDMLLADRKQLVGLLTDDPARVLEEGAQITAAANMPAGSPAIGHVTSAYASPTLGRSIALALLAGGRARMGERFYVAMPRGDVPVTVVGTVFRDPGGARLDV